MVLPERKQQKMKTYSETTDVEKWVIKEYESWCKADCDIAYKYHKAMEFMKRAT